MLLLCTTAQPQLEKHAHPHLGRLIQPRHYPRIEDTALAGIPWAVDNDAFNGGVDPDAFRTMLRRIEGLPGCLFCAAPDIVGDAELTAELYRDWAPIIRGHRLPLALVAQDGLEVADVAWDEIAALFVGGSTEFKLGTEARQLVRAAKLKGKWVHMGRVNTKRRITYAGSIGCDSFDGTTFSKWRDRWLDWGLQLASQGSMPV